MIRKTLFHYKVIEKIGQSGMGKMYCAEDTNQHSNHRMEVFYACFT